MIKNDTIRNMLMAGGLFLAVLWIGPKLIHLPEPPKNTPTPVGGRGGDSEQGAPGQGIDGQQAELTQSPSGGASAAAREDGAAQSPKANGFVGE